MQILIVWSFNKYLKNYNFLAVIFMIQVSQGQKESDQI